MSSTEPLDDPALQEAIQGFTATAFSNTPGATNQETAALQDGLRQILHNEEIPGTELSQILALIRYSVGIAEELVDAAPAQARSLLQTLGNSTDRRYARIKYLEGFRYRGTRTP
jgi:hypothetical protein